MMPEYGVKYKASIRKHLPAARVQTFLSNSLFQIRPFFYFFCLPDASSYSQCSKKSAEAIHSISLWDVTSHPDMCTEPVTAGRQAACDVHVHFQPLNASHTSMHGGRFQLKRETLGARGDRQRFSSNSEPEPLEAAGCGSHREHDQPHVAPQRHAGPPEGAPVQGVDDRRPGSRENLHHQALRAPDLLQQLPGHHRSGLRLEGAELGF